MPESHLLGSLPPFDVFYEAINDRPPFPWQSRLANQVKREGVWPKEIGIPTGLGKTACLEVALWWLASEAEQEPVQRKAPTRIWWIVNRRMLVDSTFDHALDIRDRLCCPSSTGSEQAAAALRVVSDRLRSLSADPAMKEPVEVIRLRGGVNPERPTDPSRPSIILSTVPMYGSRLLFRGYGSWSSMRPIDAALAGVDSLLLVDEAHLAPHLMRLIPALSECATGLDYVPSRGRSRPQVVALTATGDAGEPHRFELDGDDEVHPIIRQRLDATKPLRVLELAGAADLRLAEATKSLLNESPGRGATCIVFVNTPRTARAAFTRLRRMLPDDIADVVLLTGRTREWEAKRVRDRILDPLNGMSAARDLAVGRRRHLVVVATQTLEVGADVDAEYLVTEACGVRALTQRLGRLNRMGNFASAKAIYVHLPPPKRPRDRRGTQDTWPVYGKEPATVLERLLAAADSENTILLPPRSVADTLGQPGDDPGRAPEILHGILYEWLKTTTPPDGAAPVEPYFSGVSGFDSSVSLIWRSHIPEAGERLWPRATDREAVSVPISEARGAFGDEEELRRLAVDGVTVENVATPELRPGNVILLASDRGLLDEYGWEPDASSPVRDLTVGERGLPLSAEALRRLVKSEDPETPDPFSDVSLEDLLRRVLGIVEDDEDVDSADRTEALSVLLERLASADPDGWDESEWKDFVASLDREVVEGRKEVARLRVRYRSDQGPRSDELDERSLAEPVTARELDAHGQAVAARSRSIAVRVGLPSELAAVVSLAGRLHDLGKADRRFQRWLDPKQKHSVVLAKSGIERHLWSRMRVAAGWPKGGRHEALSARLVFDWLRNHDDGRSAWVTDLLVHLVVSHHGSGRPIVPPASDGTPELVSTTVNGTCIEVSADLSLIDWDQPARFRRLNDRFGPWGLALLEAIVRQADHTVSSGARIPELKEKE